MNGQENPLTHFAISQWAANVIVIGGAVVVAGCGGVPPRDDNSLDPRFAGPCEQLTIEWRSDEAVHEFQGSRLLVRDGELGGKIEFRVVRCQGPYRRAVPLLYAYKAVPVDAESAPLVVTGIPDDAWLAMTGLWADSETAELLASMGYVVDAAEFRFSIGEAGTTETIGVEIGSASGRFAFTAEVSGTVREISERRALITDSVAATTAFFGPEMASRFVLNDAVVEEASLFGIDQPMVKPTGATLDRQHTSERIFWRLPKQ